MPTKNLWAEAKLPKWSEIASEFEIKIVDFMEGVYQKQLEDIVAPFVTDIPFEVVNELTGFSRIWRVQPKPGIYSTNRVRGEIETATLFRYLNDGTNTRWAVMPDDFANESFPGTINTVAQRYNRRRIYIDNISRKGVEGRQWLTILEQMNRNKLKTAVNNAMKNAVNSVFN